MIKILDQIEEAYKKVLEADKLCPPEVPAPNLTSEDMVNFHKWNDALKNYRDLWEEYREEWEKNFK
jgi:hypothetical protein